MLGWLGDDSTIDDFGFATGSIEPSEFKSKINHYTSDTSSTHVTLEVIS
jgi:hypothetical protein